LKKKTQNSYSFYLLISSYILSALSLFVFKYINSDISVFSINPFYVGNLFIALMYLVLIGFQILIYIKRRNVFEFYRIHFIVLALLKLSTILIVASLIIFNFEFPNVYFLSHPIERSIVGGSLIFYLFLLFYIISYLVLRFFESKNIPLLRSGVNSIIFIILLFIFAIFYTLYPPKFNLDKTHKAAERVGVVFGAAVWSNNQPSSVFKQRLLKANELYKDNLISKIQLMGSNAPGENSEAKVAESFLLSIGFPQKDILLEENTTSTTEQVRYIKKILFEEKKYSDFILISDKYHLRRIQEIANFYDLKISLIGSDIKMPFSKLLYYKFRESIALMLFWLFGI